MARLLKVVSNPEGYRLEKRQIFLNIEESPESTFTMVLQFNDVCLNCLQKTDPQLRDQFVENFGKLSSSDVQDAMKVTQKELFQNMAQLVPCVGCRQSAERLFEELASSEHMALYPINISSKKVVSITSDLLRKPIFMYSLLSAYRVQLSKLLGDIPNSKKNKRCHLHSIDTRKVRFCGSWEDVWSALSDECKLEMLNIDGDSLSDSVEAYLRKHRFCPDCKGKVQKAFEILIGSYDPSSETNYRAALYKGITHTHCGDTDCRHVMVENDAEFIAVLIERAEPDIMGNRRERHAKTLDIAQEEVLTCVGIHLFERLHKVWQKMKVEEQTWQILLCLGLNAFYRKFQLALEKKQGISDFELTCKLLCEEEQAQEARKEQKRQKKKQKRRKNKTKGTSPTVEVEAVCTKAKEDCSADSSVKCESHEPDVCSLSFDTGACAHSETISRESSEPVSTPNSNIQDSNDVSDTDQGNQPFDYGLDEFCECEGGAAACDGGYISGNELTDDRCSLEGDVCSSSSSSTSRSSSARDLEDCGACNENFITSNVEAVSSSLNGRSAGKTLGIPHRSVGRGRGRGKELKVPPCPSPSQLSPHKHRFSPQRSLVELLETDGRSNAEDSHSEIPTEDIQRFKANQLELQKQRQVLRQKLQQKFNKLLTQ